MAFAPGWEREHGVDYGDYLDALNDPDDPLHEVAVGARPEFVCGVPALEAEEQADRERAARAAEVTGSKLVGSEADLVFKSPAVEVLRQTVQYANGDLGIRGPGGKVRLPMGTQTYNLFVGFLIEAGVVPAPAGTRRG